MQYDRSSAARLILDDPAAVCKKRVPDKRISRIQIKPLFDQAVLFISGLKFLLA